MLLLVVSLVVLAGCESSSDDEGSGGGATGGSGGGEAEGVEPGGATTAQAEQARTVGRPQPGTDSARVVKTAGVDLAVPPGRVPATVQSVSGVAGRRNGYVAESRTDEAGGRPSGEVVVRVPSDRFEVAVGEVRGLGQVRSSTSGGRDATAEYTDLEARIRSLTATRDQLIVLLAEAGTIGDVLAVQDRITGVQVELETLQGQLNLLDDQTSFGTITVTVAERGDDPGDNGNDDRSGLGDAWRRSVDGFAAVVEVIVIAIGPALALGLVGVAVWPVARTATRRWRRSHPL